MRSSSALGTFWEGLRRCGAWHFYGTGLPATTSPVGCWRVSTSHHLSHTRLSSSSSYSSFVAGDKLETHPMSYGPPTAPTRCSIRQTTVRRRLAEHGKMAPLLKQASNADRTQLHTSSAVPSTHPQWCQGHAPSGRSHSMLSQQSPPRRVRAHFTSSAAWSRQDLYVGNHARGAAVAHSRFGPNRINDADS